MIPPKDQLTICFAHVAYPLQAVFARRDTGLRSFQVTDPETLAARIGEADALVVSGLWRNDLIEAPGKLRFIQSISAGTDHFARDALKARGIRLASGRGANARAVSEHAMALILSLARRLPEARDNQAKRFWRPMIGDPAAREDELGGKTLLVVGLGAIGDRLAALGKAFDLNVIGIRRDPAGGRGHADSVHGLDALPRLLPQADIVALTCPLTPETRGLIGAEALRLVKPSAHLINVARGACVDEAALIAALSEGRIAAAALDVTAEEPLAATSPLWDFPNVVITPHAGGETRRYEESIIDLLLENLARLWRGETALKNEIV